MTGGVNETRAKERVISPGYSLNRMWSEFGEYVTFFREPVHQENRLIENWIVIRFP